MPNEIALPESMNAVAQNVSDEAFSDLAKGSRFLPRLTITAGLTKQVQEGKIGVGKYAIITGQAIEDLGVEIRAWVCALRLKAMDLNKNPIVSYYDPKLPSFQDISKRSLVEKQGPLAGPEFLLYLPSERKFVSFFMSSKTMRHEAPQVRLLLKQAATFKIQMIQNAKNRWHGPVVSKCSIEIEQPPASDLQRVMNEFMNPPAVEVEAVSAEEKAKAGSQEV